MRSGEPVKQERPTAPCDELGSFHDEVKPLIQRRCPRCLASGGSCLAATMIALDAASQND